MVLVDYSDSDSDETGPQREESSSKTYTGPVQVAKSATVRNTSVSKTVVDRSESGKIRVNLSHLNNEPTTKPADTNNNEKYSPPRPNKRARTDGIFSGFNALLPAAQNISKTSRIASQAPTASVFNHNCGRGLRSGINLKTGATPAFSREEPVNTAEQEATHNDRPSGSTRSSAEGSIRVAEPNRDQEVKLVGKPLMFRPLSVKRKQPRKDQALLQRIAETGKHSARVGTTQVKAPSTQGVIHDQKVKKPLFSTYDEETTILHAGPPEANDVPRRNGDEASENSDDGFYGAQDLEPEKLPSLTLHGPSNATGSDLQSLANNLGLTAAQKRQLFGRTEGAANIAVTNFSLAAEYSHNNKLIETQTAAPAYNPVRSVAPGKHSLQQLVNVAVGQKDALEESFASGKRNRKDAGSRYGW